MWCCSFLLGDLSLLPRGRRDREGALTINFGADTWAYTRRAIESLDGFSIHILSRDATGLNTVNDIMNGKVVNNSISFCPDVAFLLDSNQPENIDINPHLAKNLKVQKLE